MKASKLNNNQTKFLDEVIRDGTALPKYPGQMAARPSTVLRQMTTPSQKVKISYQARPGIRTLDKIKETGVYEMEAFVPRRTSKRIPDRSTHSTYTSIHKLK